MRADVILTPEQILQHCRQALASWHRNPENPRVERLELSQDRKCILIHWAGGPVTSRPIEECRPIFVLTPNERN